MPRAAQERARAPRCGRRPRRAARCPTTVHTTESASCATCVDVVGVGRERRDDQHGDAVERDQQRRRDRAMRHMAGAQIAATTAAAVQGARPRAVAQRRLQPHDLAVERHEQRAAVGLDPQLGRLAPPDGAGDAVGDRRRQGTRCARPRRRRTPLPRWRSPRRRGPTSRCRRRSARASGGAVVTSAKAHMPTATAVPASSRSIGGTAAQRQCERRRPRPARSPRPRARRPVAPKADVLPTVSSAESASSPPAHCEAARPQRRRQPGAAASRRRAARAPSTSGPTETARSAFSDVSPRCGVSERHGRQCERFGDEQRPRRRARRARRASG